MSMLSVPVKDLNEKTTIDNNTYVVCGNTEANKISYENLVKPLRDELNSTLIKKVEWTSGSITLAAGEGQNLGSSYKPTASGYTAVACIGGNSNGSVKVICHPNGWIYNSGSNSVTITVTYQWLFIKNF